MRIQFYVVGGEFTSFNFHGFKHGTEIVKGPFKTRSKAESVWSELSESYRPQALYKFVILEERL